MTFVKNELKKFRKVLRSDSPECFETLDQDEKVIKCETQEQMMGNREAILNITVHYLREMKQLELADSLLNSKKHTYIKCKHTINVAKEKKC